MDTQKDVTENPSKRFTGSQVFAIVLGVVIVTAAVTLLVVPNSRERVDLSNKFLLCCSVITHNLSRIKICSHFAIS